MSLQLLFIACSSPALSVQRSIFPLLSLPPFPTQNTPQERLRSAFLSTKGVKSLYRMLRSAKLLVLGVACSSILLASVAVPDGFVKFSYSGASGPDKWGSLSPAYHLCAAGKQQSPINIEKTDMEFDPALEPLHCDYKSTNATLVDNGFNIGLRFGEDVGCLKLQGKNYSLIQMHWHSPAEHTTNGIRHPLELHLVHKSPDNDLAVIAVLYQYGKADPLLLQIKSKISELSKEVFSGDKEAHIPVDFANVKALRRASKKYWRYSGSLTTPPCFENVTWTILGKVREVSKAQVAALKKPLDLSCKKNSRPTQALNGRKVWLFNQADN